VLVRVAGIPCIRFLLEKGQNGGSTIPVSMDSITRLREVMEF
jgi:hypothetical protein